MNPKKSDSFLAQTSAMLAVLLAIYSIGGDASSIDPLLWAGR